MQLIAQSRHHSSTGLVVQSSAASYYSLVRPPTTVSLSLFLSLSLAQHHVMYRTKRTHANEEVHATSDIFQKQYCIRRSGTSTKEDDSGRPAGPVRHPKRFDTSARHSDQQLGAECSAYLPTYLPVLYSPTGDGATQPAATPPRGRSRRRALPTIRDLDVCDRHSS